MKQLIQSQLESGGFAVAVAMNIEGAFNDISRGAIRLVLSTLAVPTILVDYISHMLGNRILEDTIIRDNVNSGCPQGGVLSPLLRCLVVNSLLENLVAAGFQVVGYADDILIIGRGPFLYTILERLQEAVTIVERWCISTGLSVNPDKTEVVVLTRRYKWDASYKLMLNG